MDIAIKYKIVEEIIKSRDENLLKEIKARLGFSQNDFWSDLPSEIKEAIDLAKNEEPQDRTHEDIMNEIKKRFLNG